MQVKSQMVPSQKNSAIMWNLDSVLISCVYNKTLLANWHQTDII